MKKFYATVIIFLVALSLHAQSTTDHLYGFRQQTTPGIKKSGNLSVGGEFKKKESDQLFQNLIMLTSTSKLKIYPVQLWINGDAFSATAEQKTAAEFLEADAAEHPEMKKSVVYTDNETIWKLTPAPLMADKSSVKGKTLAAKNAVVLYYKKGGRFYYAVLKKFTELHPDARQ